MDEVKRPRHIQIAINHALKQREKAIVIRDRATKEVTEIEAGLAAWGWYPEVMLFNLPAADPNAKVK